MTTYIIGEAQFNPLFVSSAGYSFARDNRKYMHPIPIRTGFITGSTALDFKNYILSLPDVQMYLSQRVPETPSDSFFNVGPGVLESTVFQWLDQPYPVNIFNNTPNNLNPGGFLWTAYTTDSPDYLAYKTFLGYVMG